MKHLALPLLAALLIAASPAEETEHFVREGETLGGIANRAGVSASVIARANGLAEPYAVRIGQKLKIPGKGAPPPQARAATPAAEGRAQQGFHVVEPGETLGGIANRAGVKASALAAANGLKEPYIVRIGQKLIIPRQHRHTVAEGETGFSIAYKYGVPYSDIAVANNLAEGAALKPGQVLVIPAILTKDVQPGGGQGPVVPASDRFIWPLEGTILTPFNSADASRGHNGIDIAASIGAPVKAAKEGKIIFAGDEPVRYGKMIIIAHAGGWHSAYGHLSSITARKGARVGAGEVIGHAGSTGDAQEPELHFELRKSNRPVDPVKQLTPPAS